MNENKAEWTYDKMKGLNYVKLYGLIEKCVVKIDTARILVKEG